MTATFRLGLKKRVFRLVESALLKLAASLDESPAAFVTREEARAISRQAYRQAECLVELRALLPGLHLQGMRGWAISPDACLELVRLIECERPALVLELGSGNSTLAIAAALKRWVPGGTVVSIDHSAEYAASTRHLLEVAGFDNADVRVAEIGSHRDSDGRLHTWYDPRGLDDLDGIDLLFVDGPPHSVADEARSPSVPFLSSRLSSRANIVIDDADRPSERRLAESWALCTNGALRFVRAEKGMAIITCAMAPEDPSVL